MYVRPESKTGLDGIRNIRSEDYSFPGTFVPTMELSFSGPFVPWTVHSLKLSFPGPFVPRNFHSQEPCRLSLDYDRSNTKLIVWVCKMMILKAKVLGLLWKQDEVKCQQATDKIQLKYK